MNSKLYLTHELHQRGQRIWIDDITRDMLNDGTLQRYRDEFSVTGLTSNPTIFEEAIGKGSAYDEQIQALTKKGTSSEELFAALAIADLQRAGDLFRPIHDHTGGLDGWVSMEVSPLLIHNAAATARAAEQIYRAAQRPNLFVKIPGTPDGVGAIEETIFSGIPVNVTLLFSAQQYQAVADAYMRALERRQAAGLNLNIASVASIFVSRWDKAIVDKVPDHLHNRLGLAIAHQVLTAYRQVISSERWCSLEVAGARAQRLLWASTGTKDPKVPADLYVSALAVPDTIDTMPPKTLLAFVKDGTLVPDPLSSDATDLLEEYAAAGVDTEALATQLQREGGDSFAKSWRSLMQSLGSKRQAITHQSVAP